MDGDRDRILPAYLQWPVRQAAVWALVTAFVPVSSVLFGAWMGGPQPTTDVLYQWVASPLFAGALALVTARLVQAAREREARAVQRAKEIGSYRLFDRIGKGGMGEVWRAEHRLLSRPVAVKLIRPDKAARDTEGSEGLRRRFLEEARATAELDSPHTVALWGRPTDAGWSTATSSPPM